MCGFSGGTLSSFVFPIFALRAKIGNTDKKGSTRAITAGETAFKSATA
jgi:hypothetical protein